MAPPIVVLQCLNASRLEFAIDFIRTREFDLEANVLLARPEHHEVKRLPSLAAPI